MTIRLLVSAIALGMIISRVTLNWPSWMATTFPSHWINHHMLWGIGLTTFIMAGTTRAAYVWHQTWFWKKWPDASIRRLNDVFVVAIVVLGFVGASAWKANYILHDNSFYAMACIWRNLGLAAGLWIWRRLWKFALNRPAMKRKWMSYMHLIKHTPKTEEEVLHSRKSLKEWYGARVIATWSLMALAIAIYKNPVDVRKKLFLIDLGEQLFWLIPLLFIHFRFNRRLKKNGVGSNLTEKAA